MKTLNKKSGFSLLELVVVVAILAVVIPGMMQLFVSATALSDVSGSKSAAMAEVYTKMEEIRNHEFTSIVTDYASGGTPGNSFDSMILSGGKGMVFASPYNGSNDILEVRIVMSWQDSRGRVIGEDANRDGVFLISEDVNNDGQYSSPATFVSYIAKRH
ncbi:MAG: prepilin-type N-terminal cleavage/methylation domain-containing protein [Candidatus Omnitrophica bacterium]|nr:prepilin-type N-terminal cleavage/methylation domain-containing protein [Candidatus Omnitrophota bacterium]MBU1997349.1 prepilin-type N-terminal cleavage/methylation domain-containing protein [Candidatus Omnitrophota bacterium]MBU4333117.1 prepilin-type N-terminal cleavage/methylation domain-containing protein [Candidatus Omnitrophota bacterium]